MKRKTLGCVGLAVVAAGLAAILLPNARSLYEGVFFYLRDTINYNPSAVETVRRDGRFGSVYELVGLRNAERYNLLLGQLQSLNLNVTRIPIPNAALPNLFVVFDRPGPYTIFSAHYDKLHDDVTYQGASDNTAAVSVLLASTRDLAEQGYKGSAAFLFTGEEESGLRGSTAFLEWAKANRVPIRGNVNFDNLGRGNLALRPSVNVPGFVFTVPLVGDYAYDGRVLSPCPPFAPVNSRLAQSLSRVMPDLVVYERFTALSDSNVFQAASIDTVAISGSDMHYLELTWHTYADRAELLDQRNLDLAFELVTRYALTLP